MERAGERKRYDLALLRCPRCGSNDPLDEQARTLLCGSCGVAYPVESGIPNLVIDAALRTSLEDIDYDAVHGITQAGRQANYKAWEEIFRTLAVGRGRVLEIGCGTGNLTWGLMHQGDFEEVCTSDLSAKYLAYVAAHFDEGAKGKTSYYRCDANHLPFRGDAFDVVVGHSVLHHVLEYEKTLHAVRKVLTGGGYAIFFEPVIQGKIFVSLILDLIQRFDKSLQLNLLSDEERRKIVHLVKHHVKDASIKGNKEVLRYMEDKYIFDIDKLRSLSMDIGFAGFQVMPPRGLDVSYRRYVAQQWSMLGIGREKLSRFEEVFRAFEGTVGLMLGETLMAPMCFLVFRK